MELPWSNSLKEAICEVNLTPADLRIILASQDDGGKFRAAHTFANGNQDLWDSLLVGAAHRTPTGHRAAAGALHWKRCRRMRNGSIGSLSAPVILAVRIVGRQLPATSRRSRQIWRRSPGGNFPGCARLTGSTSTAGTFALLQGTESSAAVGRTSRENKMALAQMLSSGPYFNTRFPCLSRPSRPSTSSVADLKTSTIQAWFRLY